MPTRRSSDALSNSRCCHAWNHPSAWTLRTPAHAEKGRGKVAGQLSDFVFCMSLGGAWPATYSSAIFCALSHEACPATASAYSGTYFCPARCGLPLHVAAMRGPRFAKVSTSPPPSPRRSPASPSSRASGSPMGQRRAPLALPAGQGAGRARREEGCVAGLLHVCGWFQH